MSSCYELARQPVDKRNVTSAVANKDRHMGTRFSGGYSFLALVQMSKDFGNSRCDERALHCLYGRRRQPTVGFRFDSFRAPQSLLSQCLDALQKDLQRVSIFKLV